MERVDKTQFLVVVVVGGVIYSYPFQVRHSRCVV